MRPARIRTGRLLPKCLMCLSIALALSGPAYAGASLPCRYPLIFKDADVNILVLQYQMDRSIGGAVSHDSGIDSGLQLAGLIQAQMLIATLKFGRVGSTLLVGSPTECDPKRVLEIVQRESRNDSSSSRKGLVIISGRFYKEKGELFVQTYLNFRRIGGTDQDEVLTTTFGQFSLNGQLSSQNVSFAPQHLADADLQLISRRFNSSVMLHTLPSEQSPAQKLPLVPTNGLPNLGYVVTDSRGEWMNIKTYTGQSGWIHARGQIGEFALDRKFPELLFAEGVVGYLSYRLRPEKAAYGTASDSALSKFQSLTTTGSDTPCAVAEQIRAYLLLLTKNQTLDAYRAAVQHFAQASTLIPYSSEAANLKAIVETSIVLWQDGPIDLKEVSGKYWAAMSLDPGNPTTVVNMWNLYQYLQEPAISSRVKFAEGQSLQTLARRAQEFTQTKIEGSQINFAAVATVDPWPARSRTY